MRKDRPAPSKRELEKCIARLRKASSAIGQLHGRDQSEGVSPEELKEEILGRLTEQAIIVDRFIGLCRDADLLKRFTCIVKSIEENMSRMEASSDSARRMELKKEIFRLLEEWINCLELIITGVVSQTSK